MWNISTSPPGRTWDIFLKKKILNRIKQVKILVQVPPGGLGGRNLKNGKMLKSNPASVLLWDNWQSFRVANGVHVCRPNDCRAKSMTIICAHQRAAPKKLWEKKKKRKKRNCSSVGRSDAVGWQPSSSVGGWLSAWSVGSLAALPGTREITWHLYHLRGESDCCRPEMKWSQWVWVSCVRSPGSLNETAVKGPDGCCWAHLPLIGDI